MGFNNKIIQKYKNSFFNDLLCLNDIYHIYTMYIDTYTHIMYI